MFWEYVVLCTSAVAAGIVNAIAGGGTLLTFPALTFFVPSTVAANVTSTMALFPGSLASTAGYFAELRGCGRWVLILTGPSILGGIIGSVLLLHFDEKVFKSLVPWLILLAAFLFLLQPMISRYFQSHPRQGSPTAATLTIIVACQFLIGVYGGYFGAGIGILMLSTLSFLGLESIHQVNALKSYLAFCLNCVSAAIFAFTGKVEWWYAFVMALAAIAGGYLGARLALKLKPIHVRRVVIVIAFGLAGYYFWVGR